MKFFQIFTLAIPAILTPGVLTAPAAEEPFKIDRYVYLDANDTEISTEPLTRRGGNHGANWYSNYNCGSYIGSSRSNFGCGGTCYVLNSANSINLWQDTSSGQQPTGSMFSGPSCKGKYQSVGIRSGNTQACTNSNIGGWKSAYLYYAC